MLLCVALNALLPILVTVLLLLPVAERSEWRNYWFDDRYLYDRASRMFERVGLLGDDPGELDAVRDRMPLYPVLLMGLRAVEEVTGLAVPFWSIVINALAQGVGACLLYLIVRRGGGSQATALVAGLLWPWLPGVLPYSLAQMPEAVGTMLFLLSSYLLVSAKSPGKMVGSGLVLGLATLAKPVFCYFCLPALVLVGLSARREKKSVVAWGLLWLVGLAMPVSGWVARNYCVWGVVTLTPNGSAHVANARDIMAKELGLPETSPGLPGEEAGWRALGIDPANLPARSAYRSKLAWEELRGKAPECLKLGAWSLVRLHGSTGTGALFTMAQGEFAIDRNAQQVEARASPQWTIGWRTLELGLMGILVVVYFFSLLGVVGLWRNEGILILLSWALLTIGYFVLISVPFGHTRYRYPAMPGYAVLASAGICFVYQSVQKRAKT